MTTVEVNFLTIYSSGVVITTGWLLAKSFRLTAANQVVQIQDIEVIQSLLTIPSAEDVQVVAYFVARVGSSARWWIVLRYRREPGHFKF